MAKAIIDKTFCTNHLNFFRHLAENFLDILLKIWILSKKNIEGAQHKHVRLYPLKKTETSYYS